MTPSDWRTQPEPEPLVCGRCGSTNLEPIEPPQGRPHHRWECTECSTVTTGSKSERAAHLTRQMADQAEAMAAESALARHREEQR